MFPRIGGVAQERIVVVKVVVVSVGLENKIPLNFDLLGRNFVQIWREWSGSSS